jgi:hypothetical protein
LAFTINLLQDESIYTPQEEMAGIIDDAEIMEEE